MKRDTPGDEIALHILCRMYNRHCVVITSAKLWSTVKTDRPMCEEKLIEICDLKFLFVEPGVFGELRSKPAMPPAPGNTVFESATEITRRDKKLTTDQQKVPFNLSVPAVPSGHDTVNVTGNNNTESAKPVIPNPTLNDAISDNIVAPVVHPSDAEVPINIASKTSPTTTSDGEVSNPELENRHETRVPQRENIYKAAALAVTEMPVCTVPLRRLQDTELAKWLNVNDDRNQPSIGYQLRERKDKQATRFDRRAKKDVKYTFSDESSDSATGRNTSQNKRRKPNIYPLMGPSEDRIKAHKQMLLKQKEQSAAEALLQLGNLSDDGEATSCNNYEGAEPSTSNCTSSSSLSDSVKSGSTSTPSTKITTDKGKEDPNADVSDADDNLPLSQLKDKLSDSVKSGSTSTPSSKITTDKGKEDPNADVSDADDNLPLSQLKDKLKNKGRKSGLTTTTHGIVKRKRKQKFSCKKCKFSGTSQCEINRHFLAEHGLLSCSTCGKKCRTISALRKHNYEHSEKAKKYPCDDCDKGFPFSSQLKLHRKKHLTALEHQCIHCKKWFKNRGELTKHLVSHSGKTWRCKKCKYTCKDPRNLRAHMHSHGDKTRYKCTKCTRGFNFYQQLKRHRKLAACPPLSDASDSSGIE